MERQKKLLFVTFYVVNSPMLTIKWSRAGSHCGTGFTKKNFLKYFFEAFIDKFLTVQFLTIWNRVWLGGVSNYVHLREPKRKCMSRSEFLHSDFSATSGPLDVAEALSADPEVSPLTWRGVSISSHPTALASQVAWITGESHISRPK
jgi:hypothetical protein